MMSKWKTGTISDLAGFSGRFISYGERNITEQGLKSVVPNKHTDYMFLYYLLKYSKDKIENFGSGTTFKEVSDSTMRSIEVSFPETIEEQRKIASVLSALDNKIEKNTEINDKSSYCNGTNGHFEIALSVENYAAVDKAYADVTAAGAEGIMEPTTEPWGQRTCYIADPEGNLVEIGSFNKE